MKTLNRYFIGIVLPSPFFDQAFQLQQYFRDYFQSKASLHSPPHITLHMPFEWKAEKEEMLTDALRRFASGQQGLQIVMNNFNCFAPRVIFIHVIPSEGLASLQRSVRLFCKKELGLFNADYKDLPFHPHVTLAFRDLKKPRFMAAWEEFKSKKFEGEFSIDRITLLKHAEGHWKTAHELALANPEGAQP